MKPPGYFFGFEVEHTLIPTSLEDYLELDFNQQVVTKISSAVPRSGSVSQHVKLVELYPSPSTSSRSSSATSGTPDTGIGIVCKLWGYN